MPETNGCRRILCVDDEHRVLEGLERTLFEHFEVSTASGGAAGLELLSGEGPFAVVVSDMRMPLMDGATFLSRVRETVPDTVRVLLTGQADVNAAIAAVNKGNIFRFLCKPCPPDVLLPSLEAAVEQYRLVTAERELLDNTLKGAVKVLTDVLSLASPMAFSRSDQIKACVAHMAERLGSEDRWKYELAAMLSQIGCIILPPDTLDKVYAGQSITPDEQQMFDEHPEIGQRLLAHIPRLEQVAAMIRGQRVIDDDSHPTERLGAEMLRIAIAVDRLVAGGSSLQGAVAKLAIGGGYDKLLLNTLRDFHGPKRSDIVRAVHVRELVSFMVLDEDVRAKNGNVVVSKGRVLSVALIERLTNWQRGAGIVEPIRVRMPALVSG